MTKKGDLIRYLIVELDEDNSHSVKAITAIVSKYDEGYVMKMLKDARKLHNGGLTTVDKTRPRTIGGCFFFIDKYRSQGLL